MRKATLEKLQKVNEVLGDEVTREDVASKEESGEVPRGSVTAVMNYGDRVDRGRYEIGSVIYKESKGESSDDSDGDESPKMQIVVDNTRNSVREPVEDNTSSISIPVHDKDKFYVKDSRGCYGVLDKVLKSGQFCPVYIAGESGNGKTMAVEQACAENNRPLVIFNVTNETTEEDLIGHYILDNGNLVWRDGPVLMAYKTGAVLCLDEIDQGTSRLMCLQTILQLKPYFVKKTGATIYPAPGFTVVATGNTKGKGDESDKFIGAQIMNEAFLERFPVTVHQDYPTKATERRILKKIIKNNDDLVEKLVEWAQTTRKASSDGIDAYITTRRLVQIANLIPIFGDVDKSIEYATNRFGTDDRDALIKTYQVTVGNTSTDDKDDSDNPF